MEKIEKPETWIGDKHYTSYAAYFRQLMGERVQKVAINAGFTCPNRDGKISTGGCTFCINEAFTPSYCQPSKTITQQINEGIEFHQWRYRKASKYLAYFQSYSNTYASLDVIKSRYEEALSHPDVIGLVIGTRPDCVNEEILSYLEELSKKYYISLEFGVESTFDKTLKEINRGHDFKCAEDAIRAAAAHNLHVGAHFILGLPGETDEMLISQVEKINNLPLTSIKFHQLQVFKGTAMARMYDENPDMFHFWTLEEYLNLIIEIIRRLRPGIIVERFASEAPPRYHYGKNWGLIRNEQLWDKLEKLMSERGVFQGDLL